MHTIVDVGSNTVRMNVYDVKDSKLKILFSKKATVGLASYVKGRHMTAAGVDRLIEVLEDFKETLRNLNIHEMHVFATASLRNVSNTQEAIDEIYRRTGVNVQVLSGQEEAELDFLGAALESRIKKGLLMDIGGGSTELVAYKDGRMLSAVSIAKGSLNSYNKHVKGILPTRDERKAIKKDFLDKLDGIEAFAGKNQYKLICGVGGTVRAALKLDKLFFGQQAQENVLEVSHIGYIINAMVQKENRDKFLKNMSLLLDVVPERIRTILPGMIILYAAAKRFKCEAVVVAQTGVREGFMFNYVLKDVYGGRTEGHEENADNEQNIQDALSEQTEQTEQAEEASQQND